MLQLDGAGLIESLFFKVRDNLVSLGKMRTDTEHKGCWKGSFDEIVKPSRVLRHRESIPDIR